ncbi:hypothetical protein D9758_011731 [Tetrapyrgos nigripes]|uniref:Uncharacterized protein n=1 Tax=Tetrapyrgos nigripes TaxID=182062 RepID=A0A8H5GD64_9AGAR|nr:hypothetical protein D9758_011731 [Tetrapyrgos nigripes]
MSSAQETAGNGIDITQFIGAVYFGGVVSFMMTGVTVVQYWIFLMKNRRDSLGLRTFVTVLVCVYASSVSTHKSYTYSLPLGICVTSGLDVACTALVVAHLHERLIQHFGSDILRLFSTSLFLQVETFLTTCVIAATDLFLANQSGETSIYMLPPTPPLSSSTSPYFSRLNSRKTLRRQINIFTTTFTDSHAYDMDSTSHSHSVHSRSRHTVSGRDLPGHGRNARTNPINIDYDIGYASDGDQDDLAIIESQSQHDTNSQPESPIRKTSGASFERVPDTFRKDLVPEPTSSPLPRLYTSSR